MNAMKSILLSVLVCGGISSAFADVVTPESTGFKFTDTKVVPTTSIKNQSETGTCWCFSVVAFLENEIIRTSGKSVDLSEMFVVRNLYPEKAQKFMRMEGEIRFNQGGGVKDVLYAWDKYGMVPESVYSGLNYGEDIHDHLELIAGLKGYLKGIVAKPSKRYSTAWLRGVNGILDAYLGEVPEKFVVDGVEYTPKTYAASFGLNMADYKAFTSFTHLQDITFNQNLKYIGETCFYGCNELETVDLPEKLENIGEQVFYACSALKHVGLPKSLHSIPFGTFYFCTNLNDITLPESITSLSDYAFYGCI